MFGGVLYCVISIKLLSAFRARERTQLTTPVFQVFSTHFSYRRFLLTVYSTHFQRSERVLCVQDILPLSIMWIKVVVRRYHSHGRLGTHVRPGLVSWYYSYCKFYLSEVPYNYHSIPLFKTTNITFKVYLLWIIYLLFVLNTYFYTPNTQWYYFFSFTLPNYYLSFGNQIRLGFKTEIFIVLCREKSFKFYQSGSYTNITIIDSIINILNMSNANLFSVNERFRSISF